MREIFSVRFFAAVGAVTVLLFALATFFAARIVLDDITGDDDAASVAVRRIDLVDRVESSSTTSIGLDRDGLTVGDVRLTLDATRQIRIVPGTPGVLHCQPASPGACAIVVDLLGEAVVWFALVPMGSSPTSVPLPAIDTLDDGVATLVNGWQLRHAPAFDRRCTDVQGNEEQFDSYREFRAVFGADFVTLFDTTTQRLVAVVCRQRVPFAPVPGSTLPDVVGAPPADSAVSFPTVAPEPPAIPPDSTVVNEG